MMRASRKSLLRLSMNHTPLRTLFKLIPIICFLWLAAGTASLHAREKVTVATLSDVRTEEARAIPEHNLQELQALVENEFDLEFIDFEIDWTQDDFAAQIDKIYRDSRVDMLLVLGLAANQIVIRRDSFPKPTFLPYVVERDLVQAPFKDGVSGKRNLSYLSYSTQFLESIEELREVVEFKNVAVLADEVLLKALPPEVLALAASSGNVTLQLVPHDGKNHDLANQIPLGVDAIMFGHLPRLPNDQLERLIEEFTDGKLPTFTYLEEGLVQMGLLATPINESVYQYAARRNALNMQAVMLGEPASQQPVVVETKSKLTINQRTAQKLGIAIDFKVLVDADVINFGIGPEDDRLDLLEITALALQENLQLKDAQFNVDIQASEVASARGRLLPQVAADGSYLKRKDDSSLVQSGFAAEDSTDVSISVSQTLYSDSQLAGYKIQSLLQNAADDEYQQIQLDVIREASLAMADVLQAESVAAIQQENLTFSEKNLELAVDRVSIGASSSADQYRWETQVSNARSAVFDAFSSVLIAKQNLNRILNRTITADLELEPLDMDGTMIFTSKEIFDLMDNTATFEKVYQFGLQTSFESSPEIQRLNSLIEAKQRELKTITRQRWMPEVTLSGQVSENIDDSRTMPEDNDGRDWQVMVNARIPLFRGGQIAAEVQRGQLELAQLENQLASLKQNIAQALRASMNNVITSLFNLTFSSDAAKAAERSLLLVTDAYSKGAVPIVDLLDAQNASISANLAEVQASIGFFRANIEMQRTIGLYEFLMSDAQKQEIRDNLTSLLEK